MKRGTVHNMKKIKELVTLLSISAITIQISITFVTAGNVATFINGTDMVVPICETGDGLTDTQKLWFTNSQNEWQIWKDKSIMVIISL